MTASPSRIEVERVTMRDGVALATYVSLPEGVGPFPVLLIRTPYRAVPAGEKDEWMRSGFAIVKQDVRGRFASEGEDVPWVHEKQDGWDTLEWLVNQPWCDGRVAMQGGSYLSFAQIAAARTGHPALKCVTPSLIGAEPLAWSHWGGALRYGEMTEWMLRAFDSDPKKSLDAVSCVRDADWTLHQRRLPYWHSVLDHPVGGAFWQAAAFAADRDRLQAPAFIRAGWFDLFIGDAFDLYLGFREASGSATVRQETRIIVGPWPHTLNSKVGGDVDFGEAGNIPDMQEQEIDFVIRQISGESYPQPQVAPIRIFVMGINQWRDEYEWPLARTRWLQWFLVSDGMANTRAGDGRLSETPGDGADRYRYDPQNPVPTAGGSWTYGSLGLREQSEIEAREDVLVYTSEPLSEALEVTGQAYAELYVSSSAPDTDFTVKLVDVHPDGSAYGVTDGIVRARFRESNPGGALMEPGKIYALTIRCVPTAYVFGKGHQLRIQISSSNFPAFSRNLNIAELQGELADAALAHQIVHHSRVHPSRIVLPVV